MFNTVQPCRVADTRKPAGPYGGPALNTTADRSFVITGQCGIPPTAQAVAFNFAIVQPTDGGHITVYPGAAVLPVSATMNYVAGAIRANNAIVPLGPAGDILVHLGQSGRHDRAPGHRRQRVPRVRVRMAAPSQGRDEE